jgi:hypothetical protein
MTCRVIEVIEATMMAMAIEPAWFAALTNATIHAIGT